MLVILQMQSLLHATMPAASEHQLLYSFVVKCLSVLLGHSAYAFSVLSILMLYAQAILLYRISAQFNLFIHNSYLVSFSFVILSSLHPSFSNFSPFSMVNLLLLFSFSEILKLKQAQKVNALLFNIGFLMMTAALLHFTILFLIPFLFFSLMLFRQFNAKEWLVVLMGLMMPIYFAVVYLFFTENLTEIVEWVFISIGLPQTQHPIYIIGVVIGISIWLLLAMFTLQRQVFKAPIFIRRCWIAIIFWLVSAIIAISFTPDTIQGLWLICLPPLSLVLTQAYQNQRFKKINAISFYFALALALFCQIFLPI